MAKKKTVEKVAVNKESVEKVAAKVKVYDLDKTYQFEGNGIAPSLREGMRYKVTGALANQFTKNGYGKVID